MNKICTRLLLGILYSNFRIVIENIEQMFRLLLISDVIHYRRNDIQANLHNSFPDREETIEQIAKKYYRNFTKITR